MANQTITTAVNYDDAAISGLLDGESITINGGALTIDADTQINQQAAAFGIVTLSSTLGGSVLIDGTKVWEVPFESSTGTPWDVAGASYGGVSRNVNGEGIYPDGVTFSADGTKMYTVGTDFDEFDSAVQQYALSTAWDIGSASWTAYFLTSSQDRNLTDLAFSADGTKMYVVGRGSGKVYQYSLSTAWNINTASYGGISFSVTGQEGQPRAIAFSADGTKMYVAGINNDTVYQYSLSTAWNLTSASFSGTSFSVAGQEAQPAAIAFKPDGSRMYVVGRTADTVYQYSLSTAWNVGSASYSGLSFNVAGQDTSPAGLAFKPDGSRMYVAGTNSNTVFQYDLLSGTSSPGNVPTQAALGSNTVTGGTSGATGELTRVWASGSFDPAVAGAAMPAAGYIKLRSKTGNFQAGETITLPGGATIVASNAGKRGAIQVIARTIGGTSVFMAVPRLSSCVVDGDWYDLGTTNGADNQTFTLPVREELGGVQIETAPGSGVYEWYANAGDIWNGHHTVNEGLTATNATLTRNAISAFPYPAAERIRETAVAGVHSASFALGANNTSFPAGAATFTARILRDTRQWVVVQFATNNSADRFGVLVDFVAGTLSAVPNVGSPTGTASSITALGGGIYEVKVSVNHTGTGAITIATSNSATPTYVNGLPSFTGSASEGVNIALSRLEMATFSFIPTDVRGKHCGVDPIAGTVQIALRGANNSGFKPPSGCKVRIPNVFLSTTQPVDSAAPMLTALNTRYYFNSGNPGPTVKGAVLNWFNTGNMVISDSCTTQYISSTAITNSCVGVGLMPSSTTALAFANAFAGGATDSRFTRRSNTLVFSATSTTNVAFRRCRFDLIARWQGLSQRQTTGPGQFGIVNLGMSNFVFEDCEVINGQTTIGAGNSNGLIKNFKYADVMTGGTPAVASSAFAFTGTNIELDGFSSLGGLSNVHPYDHIVNLAAGYFSNLKISNIGTPTAPYDCGSANPMGFIVNGGPGSEATFRRIYTTNNRTGAVNFVTTMPLVQMFDVWATGSQFIDLSGPSITSRGGRWSNFRRGFANANGTHWDDAYNSTTTGRISVMANEPTAASASQFSGTFGIGSGYTGSGSIVLSKLTDEAVWTSPYRFYGHTAFGGGGSPGGTATQNLIWEYKIDTGGGFGASWTFLANTVRTNGDPANGATTVTMNSADRAALTRQPQIGDFIQHSTFRLPQDTTITNIVGDVITVSNAFISSPLGANGTISFSPVNVAVSPTNGYLLQIRCRAIVAAAGTLTTGFSAGIQTNATDQQIPHPLPGSLVNITNLVPQSRVKVTRVDTGALLQQAFCGAGTTLNFDFQYTGSVEIEARNASGATAYRPWVTQASISPSAAANVVALQESD